MPGVAGFGIEEVSWEEHDSLAAEHAAFVASVLDGAPVLVDAAVGRRALAAALAVGESMRAARARMMASGLIVPGVIIRRIDGLRAQFEAAADIIGVTRISVGQRFGPQACWTVKGVSRTSQNIPCPQIAMPPPWSSAYQPSCTGTTGQPACLAASGSPRQK